jgi:hypothetical protein
VAAWHESTVRSAQALGRSDGGLYRTAFRRIDGNQRRDQWRLRAAQFVADQKPSFQAGLLSSGLLYWDHRMFCCKRAHTLANHCEHTPM